MRIVKPSYEILTPISEGGIKELQLIERVGRTCYKSEDRITEDGESAKKFVKMLVEHNHLAVCEFGNIAVRFTTDRGITHELVRHRLCSFAQESSRYCNYSNCKMGKEITVIAPYEFRNDPDVMDYIDKLQKLDYIPQYKIVFASDMFENNDEEKRKKMNAAFVWWRSCKIAEESYLEMTEFGAIPGLARSVLPTCTKAEINVSANYREWKNIFNLRCAHDAHLDIRAIMVPLLEELSSKIPVLFDDLRDKYCTDNG